MDVPYTVNGKPERNAANSATVQSRKSIPDFDLGNGAGTFQ